MTWKIVKVSKVSVLYIYIDNNNNQSLQYSKLFTFMSLGCLVLQLKLTFSHFK